MHFGHEPNPDHPNMYRLLTSNEKLADTLTPAIDNMLIGDANIDLAAAEVELASIVGREVILRDAIEEYGQDFDYLIMDCPPSLGVLTINALCAANEVFITLQPHFLGLQGMGKLLETVQLVAKRINRELQVTGIVLCMFETGTKLASEVVADMESFFTQSQTTNMPWSNATIFKTRIRRNIKLAEAPSYGQDIFEYAPLSNGADDYASLALEVLQMNGEAKQSEPQSITNNENIEPDSEEIDHADQANTAEELSQNSISDLSSDPANVNAPAETGTIAEPAGER